MTRREKVIASLVLLSSLLLNRYNADKAEKDYRFSVNINNARTEEKQEKPKDITIVDQNDLDIVDRYGYTTTDTILYKSPISKKHLLSVDREQLVYVVGNYLGFSQVVYEIKDGLKAVGYIPTNQIELCDNEFIEIDESSQLLRLIVSSKRVMEAPTVTGLPGEKQTSTGCYEMYDKARSVVLRGRGYEAYVDYWMPFNEEEGLHDAEYHTCATGGNHGWRSHKDFGGTTYITNGSHGCVNLYNETAKYIYDNVPVGTKVIVHK